MKLLFILSFFICFVSYCLHTIWHYQANKKTDFQKHSIFFNIITHIIVFLGYFVFGFMIYSDPLKIEINIFIKIFGLITGITGAIIGVLATIQKKGYTELDDLITTGIYSKLRNPMYFGIILIHIGLPLFFGSMFSLLSAFIWLPLIISWKRLEEKNLEKKFGEQYTKYKRKTIF